MSIFFAFSAILASFGIGNMGQVNKIVKNVETVFFANVHAPVLWGEGNSQVTLVAVILGLVLVPLISLISKAPEKDGVEQIFACYERKVMVLSKDSIETET